MRDSLLKGNERSPHNSSFGDRISLEVIKRNLHSKAIGCHIVLIDETTSTNDEAKKLAVRNANEGTVVLARVQSAGRGRFGRKWHSPEGGLYMSVILRPNANRPIQKITLMAGLSVAKTLRRLYKIEAVLRWPNDVLVGESKICGILAEGAFEGDTPLYVIIGIGLNVNVDTNTLPKEAGLRATSLETLLGERVLSNTLISELLKTIDQDYRFFIGGKDEKLWTKYRKLCKTIGSEVRVEVCRGEVYEGYAEGLSDEGGLILRTRDGSRVTILSGDCVHLRTMNKHKKGY